MLRCIAPVILALMVAPAWGGDIQALSERGESLGLQVRYLVDERGDMQLADVLSDANRPLFVAGAEPVISLGFVGSVHWYAMDFSVRAEHLGRQWFLDVAYPVLDQVELYLLHESALVQRQLAGDQIAASQRPLPSRTVSFALDIAQVGTYRVVLRVETESSQTLPLRILDGQQYAQQVGVANLWLGLYYGIILITVAFSGLIAFILGSQLVMHYCAFVILAGGFLPLSLNGFGTQYVWGEFPWLSNAITPMSMGVALYFALKLTSATLATREGDPACERVLAYERWLCLGLAALPLAFSYAFAIRFGTVLGGLVAISVIVTSLRAFSHHPRTAVLFLVAWGWYLLAVLVKVLTVYGQLRTNVLTDHALQLGLGMLIIFLAVALGERMNAERREKAEARLESLRAAHAREQAEMATRTRTTFLAKMSHELRTPMNAVIGFAELGLRRGNEAKRVQFLSQIHAAATGLLALINEILDFSKIDANRLKLEKRPLSLNRLLAKIEAMFQLQADEKDIGFVVESDPGVPDWIVSDPLRLEQIISNLVSNAMKFTEHGGVEILVATVGEEPAAMLRVEVRDTGIGIPSEQQQRLFEAFVQADDSITRRYGGSGLGLVICKQIVELMGGEIELHSELGCGSSFIVSLPLMAVEAPISDGDWSVERVDGEELPALSELDQATALKGMKVLLAEDNKLNQQLAAHILEGLGIEIQIAPNGRVAVEASRQSRFDLILMDIFMPEMDGYAASRAIRAHPETQDIPIIALSASVAEEDRQSCFDAGMNDFVAKPIRMPELVNSLLRQRGLGSAVSAPTAAPAPAGEQNLNRSLGLEYCQDNAGLYREMLNGFCTTYQDAGNELRQLLSAQSFADAQRLVHTIKGLAASLGMERLYQVAEPLEQRLRVREHDEAQVEQFLLRFQAALEAARAHLAKPAEA